MPCRIERKVAQIGIYICPVSMYFRVAQNNGSVSAERSSQFEVTIAVPMLRSYTARVLIERSITLSISTIIGFKSPTKTLYSQSYHIMQDNFGHICLNEIFYIQLFNPLYDP